MLREEMHVLVKGKVQGVGFRATTCRCARALHLTGFVRNLSHGSVEIVAQGAKKHLEQLIEKLNGYFGKEHVHEMEISFQPVQHVFTDFQVLHTEET